jgi:hypothetical protein
VAVKARADVAREEELDGAGTLTGAWRRVPSPMRMILARLGQSSRDLSNGGGCVVIGVRWRENRG